MRASVRVDKALGCAVALLLISTAGVDAQVPEQGARALWVSTGVGGSSAGFAVGFGLAFRSGPHLLTGRLVGSDTFDPLGPGHGTDITEAGIMYGRGRAGARSWRSISAGLGLVTGERRTRSGGWETQVEEFGPTAAVPIEAQLLFAPVRFLGVGVTGFANLNPEASFAGVFASLHLGMLP